MPVWYDNITRFWFFFAKIKHFVMETNSRPRIYMKRDLINKDMHFY